MRRVVFSTDSKSNIISGISVGLDLTSCAAVLLCRFKYIAGLLILCLVCFPQACIRQRMFSGVHPTTSLINHYDTVEEISRRQHRIKIRAKGKSHKEIGQ